mmetsp:Transcript_38841/g.47329  ORF Transcript_38841/g.47329 Transcript_38841/m.47329 type:complete len:228 (+) Transcript_38841:669-1352(+)
MSGSKISGGVGMKSLFPASPPLLLRGGGLMSSASLLSPFSSLALSFVLVSSSLTASSFIFFFLSFFFFPFFPSSFRNAATKKAPVSISCGSTLIHLSNFICDISFGVGGKQDGRIRDRVISGTSSYLSNSVRPSLFACARSVSASQEEGKSSSFPFSGAFSSLTLSVPSASSASLLHSSVSIFSFSPLLPSLSSLLFSASSPSSDLTFFFSSHSRLLFCILALFFFS